MWLFYTYHLRVTWYRAMRVVNFAIKPTCTQWCSPRDQPKSWLHHCLYRTVIPGATKFGPVKRYNLSLSVLSAIIQDESGSADFIAAKYDGGDGNNWSYKTCKAAVKSSPPTNQHPTFYRPDALSVAESTMSKHWREIPHFLLTLETVVFLFHL